MATPDKGQNPKNPFKPGKTSLSDLLGRQPDPGLFDPDKPAVPYEGKPKTRSSKPKIGETTVTESVAASNKRRPGLGSSGLTKISEELSAAESYDIWGVSSAYTPESATVDDSTPPEPPDDDSTEDEEDEEPLPEPDYRDEIPQSTKPYPYRAKRPDLIEDFYDDAPTGSTRVRAYQWIPVYRNGDEVIGDAFIAFARPSAAVGSSLFLYTEVSESTWNDFKSRSSFGRAISLLGDTQPHGEDVYSLYRDLHPDVTEWIFNGLGRWMMVRPFNERNTEGTRKPRSIEGKLGALGEDLAKRGITPSSIRKKGSEDD